VLPVDMSMSADDKTLFVDCFGDGKVRVFDVSNPHQPKQIYEKQIGKQLNMVSQSWDGKRLYFSSSLLARWDKLGDDNEQFVRAYNWNGKELTRRSRSISPRSNWAVRITCCSARRRLETPTI
jgi:methanethiol oxidase